MLSISFVIHTLLIFIILFVIVIAFLMEYLIKSKENRNKIILKNKIWFWIGIALIFVLVGQLSYMYIYKPIRKNAEDKKFADVLIEKNNTDSLYDFFLKINDKYEIAFLSEMDEKIYDFNYDSNLGTSLGCLINLGEAYYYAQINIEENLYRLELGRQPYFENNNEYSIITYDEFMEMYGSVCKKVNFSLFEQIRLLNAADVIYESIKVEFMDKKLNLSNYSDSCYFYDGLELKRIEKLECDSNYWVRISYFVNIENDGLNFNIFLI